MLCLYFRVWTYGTFPEDEEDGGCWKSGNSTQTANWAPPPQGVFRNLAMSSGMHFLDPTHLGLRLSTRGSKSLKTYKALGLGAEVSPAPPESHLCPTPLTQKIQIVFISLHTLLCNCFSRFGQDGAHVPTLILIAVSITVSSLVVLTAALTVCQIVNDTQGRI